MSSAPQFKHRLETTLKFGKYQGKTVEEVIEDDPDYIHWCIENVEGFELDNKAYKELPEYGYRDLSDQYNDEDVNDSKDYF